MNSAKRRMVNDTASTLAKPFRSPLKKPVSTRTQTQQLDDEINESKLSENIEQEAFSHHPADSSSIATSTPTLPPSRNVTRESHPSPSAVPQKETDQEHTALQKHYSALTIQLTKLNQSLDVARQARKITESNQDPELELLIQKWRSAARDAAEELFSTAKDRVNRMGGVGAWRERTQKPQDSGNWDEASEVDEEELTTEQREALEAHREETRKETERYGITEPEKPVERDDDSFTMDMMLNQLNVELEVIGYDKVSQRWTEDSITVNGVHIRKTGI